jgi:hypothetical protein
MGFVWSPLAVCRSGVSAERRKPLEIEECGFLLRSFAEVLFVLARAGCATQRKLVSAAK